MKSKERIHSAFAHRVTDQIPADFGATNCTGITAAALYHLRQCLGMEIPVRLYNVYESLAETDDSLEEAVGGDTLRLPQPVPLLNIECLKEQTKKWWKPYALEDGTGVLIPKDFYPERELNGDLCLRDFDDRRFGLMKRGGWRFQILPIGPGAAGMPLEDVEKELEKSNPAVAFLPGEAYWPLLKRAAGMFTKTTQKAFVFRGGPPSPFFAGLGSGATHKWLEALEARTPESEKILEKWLELWESQLEKLCEAVENQLDVLVLEEDFSEVLQDSDRELIIERIFPFYARGIQNIRKKFGDGLHILWQSAGNVTPFLPQLLKMGVNAVGFADPEKSGVNPLAIKQQFGRDVVLWGGVCSAADLLTMKRDDLLRKVQENVATLAADGGYVHACAGNILPATDPENILTYFSRREM